MRKLLGLLVSGVLVLGMAGAADAALLDFSGTIKVIMGSMRPMYSVGTGVATVNNSSGLGHLSTLRLGTGISNMVFSTQLATDPVAPTITKVIGTFGNGNTGTLGPISGGGPLTQNTLPLTGNYKVCILLAGCSSFFTVPFQSGSVGVGVGGMVTANGFGAGFRMSVQNAPWTLATASITGATTYNHMIPPANRGTTTVTAVGFVHAPGSGTSSTASIGGVVQVVTPTLITTNLQKPNTRIGLPISMAVEFVPEPGLTLLLASGVAGLALLGRRRMNR
jgi:hypothetical protein